MFSIASACRKSKNAFMTSAFDSVCLVEKLQNIYDS